MLLQDTRDARADVLDYIEVFYNRNRRHSHVGFINSEAYEQVSFCSSVVSPVPGALVSATSFFEPTQIVCVFDIAH